MRVELGEALDLLPTVPSDSVDFIYNDPPFATQRDKGDFDDRWESIDSYIKWLRPHILHYHRVLKNSGSMIIHLDWRAVHYARCMVDETFGYENMLNEIVWGYASGGAGKRMLARKHDTLLWYVKKDGEQTFNITREPYATPKVSGRVGFHKDGRMLTDNWLISFLSTTSGERLGYATQKPERLLERIIEVFTDKGDVVLDPMCGSGTTGAVAKAMDRDFIGFDRNPEAVELTRGRLNLVAKSSP